MILKEERYIMDNKIKEILDKVMQLPVEIDDGDGYTLNFAVLELQNMIRDYYASL
jgi:hypothetical protein